MIENDELPFLEAELEVGVSFTMYSLVPFRWRISESAMVDRWVDGYSVMEVIEFGG